MVKKNMMEAEKMEKHEKERKSDSVYWLEKKFIHVECLTVVSLGFFDRVFFL